jgi:hypothetical protein
MGGIGSGPPKGIKYERRGALRVAPIWEGVKLDIWQWKRDEVFLGGRAAKYAITHKGEQLAMSVCSGQWEGDKLQIALSVDGAMVALRVFRLNRGKFLYRYTAECPCCLKTFYHLYFFDGQVKCRHCHGLHYRTYDSTYSPELIALDYRKMLSEREACAQKIAEREGLLLEGKTIPDRKLPPWYRIKNLRKRLADLDYQLRQIELSMWEKAEATL